MRVCIFRILKRIARQWVDGWWTWGWTSYNVPLGDGRAGHVLGTSARISCFLLHLNQLGSKYRLLCKDSPLAGHRLHRYCGLTSSDTHSVQYIALLTGIITNRASPRKKIAAVLRLVGLVVKTWLGDLPFPSTPLTPSSATVMERQEKKTHFARLGGLWKEESEKDVL